MQLSHKHTHTHAHTLNVFFISNPKACKMYTIPCRSFSKGQKWRRETRATFSGALGCTDGERGGKHRRTSTKSQSMMHFVCMRALLQHIVSKTGLQNCLVENQNKTLNISCGFFSSECLCLITPVHHFRSCVLHASHPFNMDLRN